MSDSWTQFNVRLEYDCPDEDKCMSNEQMVSELVNRSFLTDQTNADVFRLVDKKIFTPEPAAHLAYYMTNTPWEMDVKALACVADVLQLKKGMRLLLIGSGTGYFSAIAGVLLGKDGVNVGVEQIPYLLFMSRYYVRVFLEKTNVSDFCEPEFVPEGAGEVYNICTFDRIFICEQFRQPSNLTMWADLLEPNSDSMMITVSEKGILYHTRDDLIGIPHHDSYLLMNIRSFDSKVTPIITTDFDLAPTVLNVPADDIRYHSYHEMVDQLIRLKFVVTPAIGHAIRSVDMCSFIPQHYGFRLRDFADERFHFADIRVIAQILEIFQIQPGKKFLHINCGSGYVCFIAGFLVGMLGVVHGIDVDGYLTATCKLQRFSILKLSTKCEIDNYGVPKFFTVDPRRTTFSVKYDYILVSNSNPNFTDLAFQTKLTNMLTEDGVKIMINLPDPAVPYRTVVVIKPGVSQRIQIVQPQNKDTENIAPQFVLPFPKVHSLKSIARFHIRQRLKNICTKDIAKECPLRWQFTELYSKYVRPLHVQTFPLNIDGNNTEAMKSFRNHMESRINDLPVNHIHKRYLNYGRKFVGAYYNDYLNKEMDTVIEDVLNAES